MKAPANGLSSTPGEGEKKNINSELWHACAGPLVSLPPVGSLVVYFPQGHSEQVAATMQKETDSIPNYPSLPSKLICVLHNVTLHADVETDEVYAQMTLQPVNKYDKDALLASDLGLKQNKQPTEFFCKTLTASDTSTHGGFSVPRRAAEKIFPPLDFSMQPPAQELVAKDLHDVTWTFRHVYRGQPKRHLLTTGWSVFVSTKRLLAGDSVLFIRDEKSQLLLGIRRANRQQPALSSSVLSSDSMHIGVLAAAAHAAANNSPFTIFYNPRASPSEFVVPLAKYNKAMYTQVSLGMRFRMMFETEESGVRRYMGTITGISDLDPSRWKNSQWRNLQVGWDESTAGERQNRVSIWEIEPVATPFYICPPPFFRPKLPRQPGMPDDESEVENAFKRAMPWLSDDVNLKDTQSPLFPGLNLVQWMNMQRNPQLMASAAQSSYFPSMMASTLQNNLATDDPAKILNFSANALPLPNLQFTAPKQNQPQQLDGVQQASLFWSQQQQQQQQQQFLQQHHIQQQFQLQQQSQQQPIPVQTQPPIQQTTNVAQLPHQTIMQQHQQPQASIHQPQQVVAQVQLKQNVSPIHPPQAQTQKEQQQQQQHLQQLRHQEQSMLQNQSQMQQIKSVITGSGIVDHQQRQSQSQIAQTSSQQQTFIVQQPSQHQSFVAQSSPQHQPFGNQFTQIPQTQIQQTGILIPSSCAQQAPHSNNLSVQSPPIPQNLQFQLQQQIELQQGLLHKQQPQLQLLQKMQQQLPQQLQQQLPQQLQQQLPQQQALAQINPYLQSHLLQQQLPVLQNQQFQSQLLSQQQLPCSIPCAQPVKDQRVSENHVTCQVKHQLPVKDPLITNVDAPSCSTSPFNICPISPTDLLNRRQQGSVAGPEIPAAAHPANGFAQGLQCKSDTRVKQELNCTKESEHKPYRNTMADQLEASSSATSFCMDRSTEENFSLPPLCIDGEVHADSRNNLPFGSTADGLIADTLLPRGFGSGKDLQNFLTAYGAQRDIETEISTAAFSSQSFGVPDISFKPGCSSDAAAGANENGIMNRGTWVNQPQRMRTYTKVHKRGSVGRSIDVTRYRGYDELRRDLACMFGIDGQLGDPHRSEWKLVYVDHENDILLVGDDPWEEFVTCVQSIKILSAAEVQQMSLDGDLAGVPPQNQAGSGSDNGNTWRNHYESNSANSFDR